MRFSVAENVSSFGLSAASRHVTYLPTTSTKPACLCESKIRSRTGFFSQGANVVVFWNQQKDKTVFGWKSEEPVANLCAIFAALLKKTGNAECTNRFNKFDLSKFGTKTRFLSPPIKQNKTMSPRKSLINANTMV